MRGKAVKSAIPFLVGMLGDGVVVGLWMGFPVPPEELPPGKEAAKALVALGEKHRLLEFVKDRDLSEPIRVNVIMALGEISFPGVFESFLKVSQNTEEKDGLVRFNCNRYFGQN